MSKTKNLGSARLVDFVRSRRATQTSRIKNTVKCVAQMKRIKGVDNEIHHISLACMGEDF